jgi:hypothetical protein
MLNNTLIIAKSEFMLNHVEGIIVHGSDRMKFPIWRIQNGLCNQTQKIWDVRTKHHEVDLSSGSAKWTFQNDSFRKFVRDYDQDCDL